jgi:phage-related minor tail protein
MRRERKREQRKEKKGRKTRQEKEKKGQKEMKGREKKSLVREREKEKKKEKKKKKRNKREKKSRKVKNENEKKGKQKKKKSTTRPLKFLPHHSFPFPLPYMKRDEKKGLFLCCPLAHLALFQECKLLKHHNTPKKKRRE